jgi:pimeloyl-[acyl-carrier protein] methyl ester esterase
LGCGFGSDGGDDQEGDLMSLKLVLLPGMDGSGILFAKLEPLLAFPFEVIRLPGGVDQSYEYLVKVISAQLPCEDFILVAESFSGPIATLITLAQPAHLKGVIFVATFLQTPSPILMSTARHLPLKKLIGWPFVSGIVRHLLLGSEFPMALFFQALETISQEEFDARLAALRSLNIKMDVSLPQVPALYLEAKKDYFVTQKHGKYFKNIFPNIVFCALQGTHFLLQSNPTECADKINEFTRQNLHAS